MYWKAMLFMSIFVPNVAFAAIDFFLKIEGVEGESTTDGHEDEIDILGVSWLVSSSGRLTCIEGFDVVKVVDLSSAELLMGQAEGRVYPEAILTATKSGESRFDFLVITFRNVSIGKFSTSGTGGDDRLTENVTLNFERATYTYTAQNPDGSAGTTKSADLFTRTRCK